MPLPTDGIENPHGTSGLSLVLQAWALRDGPAVLTTVDASGVPNSVYVGELGYLEGFGFVVANNYFQKTFDNLSSGHPGSILFLTRERKSIQVKGSLSYHLEGPAMDFMRSFHNPKHPGHGAVVLRVESAYQGAHRLL